MRLSLKTYTIITCFISFISIVAAQRSTSILQNKIEKRRINDSLNVRYNFKKVSFTFEIGESDINTLIGNYNGQGLFGELSQSYKEDKWPPIFGFNIGYGIGRKSNLGISASFQQVKYIPKAISPDYRAGDIAIYVIGIRYMHCIKSWKHFYYGVQVGYIFWKPNIDADTFYGQPLAGGYQSNYSKLNLYFLAGYRQIITRGLSIMLELVAIDPENSLNVGIAYKIDNKRKH